MRKTLCLVLLLAILLSACGSDTTPAGISTAQSIAPPATVPATVPTTTGAATTGAAATTRATQSPGHMTLIEFGIDYTLLPVSYDDRYGQRLTGDGGWYHEVESLLDVQRGKDLPVIDISGMYSQGVPPEKTGTERIGMLGHIRSDGQWNFFPTQAVYHAYSADSQPDNPLWADYFYEIIQPHAPKTPLMIVEVWTFDWNGDGLEDAVVNAGNSFYSTDDTAPNPPDPRSTAVYTLSALFVSGCEPFALAEYIFTLETQPLDGQISASYRPSPDNTDETAHFVSAYQVDNQGAVIVSPIYSRGEFDYFRVPEIVLCDIDGNGVAELLMLPDGIYAPLCVFALENGRPVKRFWQYTPA